MQKGVGIPIQGEGSASHVSPSSVRMVCFPDVCEALDDQAWHRTGSGNDPTWGLSVAFGAVIAGFDCCPSHCPVAAHSVSTARPPQAVWRSWSGFLKGGAVLHRQVQDNSGVKVDSIHGLWDVLPMVISLQKWIRLVTFLGVISPKCKGHIYLV